MKIELCGLHVNPEFSFIGASPDAIASCTCCGTGVIEVKCPYALGDSNLDEILNLKVSYLEYDEPYNISLKKNHQYYY